MGLLVENYRPHQLNRYCPFRAPPVSSTASLHCSWRCDTLINSFFPLHRPRDADGCQLAIVSHLRRCPPPTRRYICASSLTLSLLVQCPCIWGWTTLSCQTKLASSHRKVSILTVRSYDVMARKRKRSSAIRDDQEPPSKRSTDHHARRRSPDASTPRHPVLQQFYPEVRSLRAHVLSTLEDESEKQRCIFDHIDAEFAQFVNSTIVGSGLPSTTPASRQARVQQFISFSQQVSGSTAKSADSVLISSQNEVCL